MFTLDNIGIMLVFMAFALSLLPVSPFTAAIDAVGYLPYLQWLNWFLPISECIAVGQAWLLAITYFYIASAILRWVKAIE